MRKKPQLSFWQIWNMSFGFLGIQFGFALQNANVSRIFETLGANVEDIPILWIAAPVTGLLIQPIIGYLSDKTWNRLGRRRPFFLVGAILATISLFVMPNSPVLWVAAGMLWIMDASINISMEPFRAFVGDMLSEKQRTLGFAMQSFFIGIGAVVASALPYIFTNWLGISNIATGDTLIPPSVKFSFYIGGAVFLLAVLWTIISTKEYSPEELEEFEKAENNNDNKARNTAISQNKIAHTSFFKRGGIWFSIGVLLNFIVYYLSLEKELYVLSGGVTFFGAILLICGLMTKKGKSDNGLLEIITDLLQMPKTMIQLSVVQFFSWLALFSMWIYTTNAVTTHIYHASDTSSALYNDGADWVGVLFGIYNGFAAVVAFLLPQLAKLTNKRVTHSIALVCGGVGLASIYFIQSPQILIISMLGIGVAWASILSMPYSILSNVLPSNKMGIYMGIFNFFIVIPQILAATILGFITKNLFGGQAVFTLMLGGGTMLIASIVVLFVDEK